MVYTFLREKSKIVAALKFDESSMQLLRSIHSLCRKTSMSMRAVHVVHDYASDRVYYPDYFGSSQARELMSQEQDREAADAGKRLRELVEREKFQDAWESKAIVSKDTCAALLAESHDASILAIAVERHRYQLIPRGLSVVLSLLANSNIPILIIRDGSFDFSQRYSLLIADDLSPSSEHAAWFGTTFGLASGASDIVHTHILHPKIHKFEEHLEARGEIIERERFKAYVDHTVTSALSSRSGWEMRKEDFAKVGCSYRALATAGKVSEELDLLAKGFNPHIVVMGRSASARAFTPCLSRLALNTVLSRSQAVLMVPPT